jgi:mRNA interferase HicA
MKRRDLIKKIEEGGAVFIRHGGKHDWYQNPKTKWRSPCHGIPKSRSLWHVVSLLRTLTIGPFSPMIAEYKFLSSLQVSAAGL